jgi:asparagine synthase (glutamine-hydrolysing)
MCGIWIYVDKKKRYSNEELYHHFMRMTHRGPDHSSFQEFGDATYVGFHRLAIMDTSPLSNQPFVLEMPNNEVAVFVCNGEIYNFVELNERYNLGLTRHSDCLVIPLLYKALGGDYQRFLQLFQTEIKGEFSFVMTFFRRPDILTGGRIDPTTNEVTNMIVGRDHIGVRPLYYGIHRDAILFSSEIKSCNFFKGTVSEFPPGTIQRVLFTESSHYCIDITPVDWVSNVLPVTKTKEKHLEDVRTALASSVLRRLHSDTPVGFLLSGGVDSSLVVSVASRLIGSGRAVRTFCCGMEGGTDLLYARKVAEFLETDHTEVIFTAEEALAAINDVIYTVETWDTTTIRASVGQYLVAKYISQHTNIKVLLVGEGPDEVCSSYLYNWYAPSPEQLHHAAVESVKDLHKYDLKRVDRCLAAFGLEARVPYLDTDFIQAYWQIPAADRVPQAYRFEKWWLRRAFDPVDEPPFLPSDVLWRRKEAFSDGISAMDNSWFQIIQRYILENYGMTEEQYYTHTFVELFGKNRLKIIEKPWQPKWNADGTPVTKYVDPSARTLGLYERLK